MVLLTFIAGLQCLKALCSLYSDRLMAMSQADDKFLSDLHNMQDGNDYDLITICFETAAGSEDWLNWEDNHL
jgi:hypothetical protein